MCVMSQFFSFSHIFLKISWDGVMEFDIAVAVVWNVAVFWLLGVEQGVDSAAVLKNQPLTTKRREHLQTVDERPDTLINCR